MYLIEKRRSICDQKEVHWQLKKIEHTENVHDMDKCDTREICYDCNMSRRAELIEAIIFRQKTRIFVLTPSKM